MPSFCAIYDTLFEPLLTEQLNLLLKIAKERAPVYTSIFLCSRPHWNAEKRINRFNLGAR